MPLNLPPQRRSVAVLAATALLALSACAPQAAPEADPHTAPASGLPSSHVHGLSVDPETGQVLLASHDGLFDVTGSPATKIGETNDLMGFTAADQDVFYASGHPGPGSDLPNPMGLNRSTDGGETWEQLSRQGQSDFHALAATKSGVVAYDGTLQTSPDGKKWFVATAGFVPAVLAGSPETDTVLATTPEGVHRSDDGGKTWALSTTAPVIQFAAFASATDVFGVEPDGSVHYSADAGSTWTRAGRIEGEVQAVAAAAAAEGAEGAAGKARLWAATTDSLVVSTDGGATFRPAGS